METERRHSAGGVVARGSQILLISTLEGRWQLPKGHIEAGEAASQAAVREIREETGISARTVAALPNIRYSFTEKGRRHVEKTVEYYLLEYVSGNAADFDPREVTGAEWFPWNDGIGKLSFASDRRVVEAAREIMETLDPRRPSHQRRA